MIEIRTLGPLDIQQDGADVIGGLTWKKNRAVLLYLACRDQRSATRDTLIGTFWADRPAEKARHSLRETTRIFRRQFGDDAILTQDEDVRLAPDRFVLDLEQFDRMTARDEWRRAARLVRGEFAEGLVIKGAPEFEAWLEIRRDAWRGRAVEALCRAIDGLLAGNGLQEAAEFAGRALHLAPTSDAAVQGLMKCQVLAGNRTAALGVFDAFAERLTEVGGIPETETLTLVDRIRSGAEKAGASWREGETPRPPRRAPFVGRDRELKVMMETWQGCVHEQVATAAIIRGDPGTGKSRLAEELLGRCLLAGALTVTVRAVPADRGAPRSIARTLLRAGLMEAPGGVGASPSALATLADAVPELRERFPSADGRVGDFGVAFSEFVVAAAENVPVVLYVDEAQNADAPSMELLHRMLRDARDVPVLLVITAPRGSTTRELDDLHSRIGRDLPGREVRLDAFNAEEIDQFVQQWFPDYEADQRERLVRRVLLDSGGVPLLAIEMMHAVKAGLELTDTAPGWPEPFRTLEQTLPSDLPDAVTAAIRVAFRRLSIDAEEVLKALSVLDDRGSPGDLASLSGLDADAVDRGLDEAEWEQWIAHDPRGYSFVARIGRDVVRQDMLTRGQRRRLVDAVTRLRSSGG